MKAKAQKDNNFF